MANFCIVKLISQLSKGLVIECVIYALIIKDTNKMNDIRSHSCNNHNYVSSFPFNHVSPFYTSKMKYNWNPKLLFVTFSLVCAAAAFERNTVFEQGNEMSNRKVTILTAFHTLLIHVMSILIICGLGQIISCVNPH